MFIHKMDVFQDAIEVDSKKVYQIQALYNTDSTLEFVIQPERDFIFANDIFLNFHIEIDKHYVMDNQADKLFDSVEVIVNNEKVSSRSNSNEYFLSSFFQTKANHPADHFSNVLRPAGWFTVPNWDTEGILTAIPVDRRAQYISDHTEHKINNDKDELVARSYYFSMQINTPLFQQMKPLPSAVPIHINFKRSKPEIALLKVNNEENNTYNGKQIEIKDPYLEVTAVRSEKLAKRLNLSGRGELNYPVDVGVIRTHTIEDGLNHIKFNATTGGKLPIQIFTGLMTPDAFHGDFTKSASKFCRHNLRRMELFVDNKALPGSQINCSEENSIEAYTKFSRNCKAIPNVFVGRMMGPHEYAGTNFITAYDMSGLDVSSGWLTVNLDFEENIKEKLMLVVYMVFEKTITFDKHRYVTIS